MIQIEREPADQLKALVRAIHKSVPSEAIDVYFGMAVTQLLLDTRALTTSIKLRMQSGVYHYHFNQYLPDGFFVTLIDQVNACGQCIDPMADCSVCGDMDAGYQYDGLNQLIVHPPGCCDDVTVDVVLGMTHDSICDSVPTFISRNRLMFLDLIASLLLGVPGQSWSDTRESIRTRRSYISQVNQAKNRIYEKHSTAPVVLPSPRFI